jgi:aspartate dehydrogenase
MQRARIGLIGCGAIASVIVDAVAQGRVDAEIAAMMDLVPAKCRRLAGRLPQEAPEPAIAERLEGLLAAGPSLVVEAASQEAVRLYAERVLEAGVDLVVLSVGALLDQGLLGRLLQVAEERGARIYVPSGAIGGLDAVRAARHAGIERVVLRTVKPPHGLGVEEPLPGPRLLYRGPASEAVKRYPFNVNVAAALALAAGTEPLVEVVVDPGAERNRHEILVDSKASSMRLVFENAPSPDNPRTSLLAALSVVELLRRITARSGLEVGT